MVLNHAMSISCKSNTIQQSCRIVLLSQISFIPCFKTNPWNRPSLADDLFALQITDMRWINCCWEKGNTSWMTYNVIVNCAELMNNNVKWTRVPRNKLHVEKIKSLQIWFQGFIRHYLMKRRQLNFNVKIEWLITQVYKIWGCDCYRNTDSHFRSNFWRRNRMRAQNCSITSGFRVILT